MIFDWSNKSTYKIKLTINLNYFEKISIKLQKKMQKKWIHYLLLPFHTNNIDIHLNHQIMCNIIFLLNT